MAAFYEFRLISAIFGFFQDAKACQFHAFQHVLNQVRLVRDPLLQMHSAEELFEFRTELKGALTSVCAAARLPSCACVIAVIKCNTQ